MKTKVQRWGNSLAVRIPKVFAEDLGICAESPVDMKVVDGTLLVEPSPTYAPKLEDLLDGITEENRHDETDWGEPQGSEVW